MKPRANEQKLNFLNFNYGVLLLVVAMLLMMILPLSPMMLDFFFVSNITLSLIVLMVCIYVMRPLEFSIFPTVLLVATLLRLTLNIASTRVVLLHGHAGPAAAGQVIRAFGEVVVGGNFVVGMIVFCILMIINFSVVTKGSGRVSEVSARFTLDAMPGKQMSIDADLNAGMITQEEARRRRLEVIQESDFYGSMDGASKFVRGDAVAGLLILFINLIGGIIVGVFQHDMPLSFALKTFALLTIGDGLVAQIPSLLMSVAAAIMVTRVSHEQDISEQTMLQLFTNPKPIAVTAIILLVIGLIPGMPHFPFLLLSFLSAGAIFFTQQKNKENKLTPKSKLDHDAKNLNLPTPAQSEGKEASWDNLMLNDAIVLEIGLGLVELAGINRDGQLVGRVRGVRKKISRELGFVIPAVHIKDNSDLSPDTYRIILKNTPMAVINIYPKKNLAINPGHISVPLQGIAVKDPAFGLDAVWVDDGLREFAGQQGYTVVDPATVIATHLNYVIRNNSSHLLGYDEVQKLLDRLATSSPKLVETLTSGVQGVPLHVIVNVLQRLLQAGIPIVDMRTIAEKIIASWAKNKDIDSIVKVVRIALKNLIVYSICSDREEIPVAVLDGDLAQILHKSIQQNQDEGEKIMSVEPSLTEKIHTRLLEYVRKCEIESLPAIMLVSSELRGLMEKLFHPSIPTMHFLSQQEIPDDRRLSIVAKIG